MVGLVADTDENLVARSLSRFSGVTVLLELSVPLWGSLFDLTGNYVQRVLLLPEMLTLMRLLTGTLKDSSPGARRTSYLRLPFWGEGVSMPLLRRTW